MYLIPYRIKRLYRRYLKLKKLIRYNKALLKEDGPMPGTIWYFLKHSPSLNYIRSFIYFFMTLLILLLFSIYRFLPENESFFILLYIIAFSSSLFYIEFIRIGISI
jgi:hypothetical protein